MNLLDEFRSVVSALNDSAVPYAVCGGMAMAVYGLEAPDASEEAWTNRQQIDTEFGNVWFASKAGLIDMKRRSGKLQDLADIEHLEGGSS